MSSSPMNKDSSMVKIGPAGSQSGSPWDEKGRTRITQIFVYHDDKVRSIQFQYAENGMLVLSERHGSDSATKFDVVKLKLRDESITSISGHLSASNGSLHSIKFGTNTSQYGPFGRIARFDKEFSFNLGQDRSQFGGFYGTASSSSVESIGFYLNLKSS